VYASPSTTQGGAVLRIDHVILAAADLDTAAEDLLARTGLASVAGGRHPGRGTANRIVPLAESYVEIMGVVDRSEAEASDYGGVLLDRLGQGAAFMGWCLATDDLDAVCRRLSLEAVPGSRIRPDGRELRWRTAGVGEDEALPFFIQWDVADEDHPARDVAPHRVRPSGIARVDVSVDAGELDACLSGQSLPVRVVDGPPGVRSVVVATEHGEVTLP
jgi:hypothetical protein